MKITLTPNPIQARIDAAVKNAEQYAMECATLLAAPGLEAAMEHCRQLRIAPPQCSLTAVSANAENKRQLAARMLSETKWWAKRLEARAIQDFEREQMAQGRVTNIVSDEMLEFMSARRRK